MIGNGAIILTVPDAPTNLAEDYSLRAVRQLSVTWSQGYAGGTPVIDYKISFSENMGPIQVQAENWLATAYTKTDCNSGSTYNIWVQSRNSFGISEYSAAIQLVCAFIPAIPNPPQTSVIANNVILTWAAPNNNGANIQSYRISIRQKNGQFSE